MQLTYLDFELEIGTGEGRDFPVLARSPAGEAHAMMRFPFDELALESRLKDLQIALLRSGGKRRQLLSPEQQAVRSFGQALFDALFSGEVRNRYDVSLQQARSQGKGLRIRLQAQSPSAAALPWEYLYDTRQSEYCALSVETPVVRYLELPQPITPLRVIPPLRMLGMVASPADLPALDIAQEKQRIEQSIQGLRAAGRLDLEWLGGQTWRDLQGALRRGPWHILHFSGHGCFDAPTDEGQLIFANDQGRARVMPASDVGRLLANHHTLRLAWLNACEGARGSEQDIFSSAASILVRRGIPAVVAMQHEITDRAAIELARTFYEAVADGYPVDAALAEARVGVSLAINNTVEWGTPALFMRAPDGVLFDLAGPAQVEQTRIETPAPVEMAAKPVPQPIRPLQQEAASTRAIGQPVAQPALPTTVQKPRQRSLGRVLLSVAALVVVIGAITFIASKIGSPAGPSQSTDDTMAQGTSTSAPASGSDGAAAALTIVPPGAPSETATQPPVPLALPGKVEVTDQGATVLDPIRMELVRVPAGEFLMGSDREKDPDATDDELPQHRVGLADYLIGKYEITNGQYAAFVGATGHRAPFHWESGIVPFGQEDHPVVVVSWDDAVAFAEWLSSETGWNFRLPSEAEWEKACRGPNGLIYPWGDSVPEKGKLNYGSNIGDTTPVGSYSPYGDSPYGAADMAGNAWEWVADQYSSDYYATSPTENPEGPEGGDMRAVRGGSYDIYARSVRCAVRYGGNPYLRFRDIGFRVVVASP